MEHTEKLRIAILGAGAAGLAAVKCCLDEGLMPFCFDSEAHIGGQWNLENERHILKSTVTNASKEMSAFSDFLIPKEFPNFMTPDTLMKYFEMYAKEFDLRKYIHLKHEVCKVEPVYNDDGKVKNWTVDYRLPSGELETKVEFDAVIVATGYQRVPYISEKLQKALEGFSGEVCHSSEYQDFEKYIGKTVVVSGIGNSGGDVACELSYHAKQVYYCTANGSYLTRRFGFGGLPYDLAGLRRTVASLPRWLFVRLAILKFKSDVDHESYGLQPIDKLNLRAMVNDELMVRIPVGKVLIKSSIKCCNGKEVELSDGTILKDVDAIILSTGFKREYPFLPKGLITLERESRYIPLYKYIFSPSVGPSLSFLGCFGVLGPVFPLMEMQARYVAAVLNKKCTLPSEDVMKTEIELELERVLNGYVPNTYMQADYIHYCDDLAEQIGAKPNVLQTMMKDPVLGLKLLAAPTGAAQYRLTGPNAWSGARDAIMNLMDRVWYPVMKEKRGKGNNGASWVWVIIFVLFLSILSRLLFL